MFGELSHASNEGGDALISVQTRGSPIYLPTTTSSRNHQPFQRIKPTVCECGQSFTHNWHLRRHKKMCALHKTNKPRDLLCSCGRHFGELSDMAQHLASSDKHKEDALRSTANSVAAHPVSNKAPLNPLATPVRYSSLFSAPHNTFAKFSSSFRAGCSSLRLLLSPPI